MKKFTVCLILAVFLCAAAAAAPARAGSLPDLYDGAKDAVVQVINMAQTWSMENGESTEVDGRGTGVCVAEGCILTTYDVVNEADYVEIRTLDGQTVRAGGVYTDESTNLAVLKLGTQPDGMKPVPLGDSAALRVGETAAVISWPVYGDIEFPGTLSVGVISGLNRNSDEIGGFSRTVPLIQFDAPLNEGASGGALFNEEGELVGLTARRAGLTEDDIYQGIGFAIPSETIMKVVPDLIEYGVVRRVRMGIMVYAFDGPEEPISTYPPAGMLVDSIEKGGPADRAGLIANDIITVFDGVRVHTFPELSDILDSHSPGDIVHVVVYRCLDKDGYMIDNPEFLEFDIELEILD